MAVSELSWDVEVPGRASSSFESARRRGYLTVATESHGTERIAIPVIVAKMMKARRDSGELACESRGELLYHLREQGRGCAWSRVAKLVNRREYSAHDLLEKLKGDGYDEPIREEVVARALDCGLVDDTRFAASFVRSKVAAGWGVMRIRQEIARHGVDIERLPGWPEQFLSDGDEEARAYDVARSHRVTGNNDYAKLVRYLCARGFTQSCAMRVASRVVGEREDML